MYSGEVMSIRGKRELFQVVSIRYHKARKVEKGRSTTKPSSILRTEIPIQGSKWDIEKPGFVEADTVAHCGESAKGSFISSLTPTDIATQWTENRAIWSKSGKATLEAIKDMQKTFPFELKGFDSDNGSEFLNKFLKKYFLKQNIHFTRSRPYRKNDNAYAEHEKLEPCQTTLRLRTI